MDRLPSALAGPELAAAAREEIVAFARAGKHGWPERFADRVNDALAAPALPTRDYLVRAKAAGIRLAAVQLLALHDARRGWEQRMEIRDRVRNTLRFVATRVQHEHGFYAHFLNIQNGERVFQSEVSSVDTAIFLCGVLTCRAYFDDAEIYELATTIFERVDWRIAHGCLR